MKESSKLFFSMISGIFRIKFDEIYRQIFDFQIFNSPLSHRYKFVDNVACLFIVFQFTIARNHSSIIRGDHKETHQIWN